MDTATIAIMALGMFVTTVLMTIWSLAPNNSQALEDSYLYTTWHII